MCTHAKRILVFLHDVLEKKTQHLSKLTMSQSIFTLREADRSPHNHLRVDRQIIILPLFVTVSVSHLACSAVHWTLAWPAPCCRFDCSHALQQLCFCQQLLHCLMWLR